MQALATFLSTNDVKSVNIFHIPFAFRSIFYGGARVVCKHQIYLRCENVQTNIQGSVFARLLAFRTFSKMKNRLQWRTETSNTFNCFTVASAMLTINTTSTSDIAPLLKASLWKLYRRNVASSQRLQSSAFSR